MDRRSDECSRLADLVFVNAVGEYVDDDALRDRFYDALDGVGLKRLRLHDLRHSFGSLAVQAWPLSDVKAYMGHADLATTMIYIHHQPRARAADELTAVIDAAETVSQPCHEPGDSEAPERNSEQLSHA
jgi:integrase